MINILYTLMFIGAGFAAGALIFKLLTKSEFIAIVTESETKLRESERQINDFCLRISLLNTENSDLKNEISVLKQDNARLKVQFDEALKNLDDQKLFIAETSRLMKDSFNALSADALRTNNQAFMHLAQATLEKHVGEARGDLDKRQQAIDGLVKPLTETLGKFDAKIHDLEQARLSAYGDMKHLMESLQNSQEKLQRETNSLVTALKTSHVRGRYGEIALRRVVEFAGMNDYCDFNEQVSVSTDNGRLRPDLVIKLPGSRTIIVDSKVPLHSYIQAFETTDETERKALLIKHSTAVREHLRQLSAKAYWNQFDESPDFVLLYMQIESSFGTALEFDRSLIEDGFNNKIIFATPTTLITLLRTVAFSWQQMTVTESSRQVWELGKELYNRTHVLLKHFSSIGSNLSTAVDSYNKCVGSLESRFMPQARKLREIGGSIFDEKEPDEPRVIDTAIRQVTENVIS